MAVLYQPASSGTFDLPSGTGHVLVGYSCELRGRGPGRTVITLDGSYPAAVWPTVSVASITLRDCTIDCDGRAEVLGALFATVGAIDALTLRNVEILNMQYNGIAVVNNAVLDAEGVSVHGNGAAFQSTTTSTATNIRASIVRGCRAGFVNSTGVAGSTPGILIDGMDIDHGYFASPTYEAVTVTGFGDTYADVEGNDTAARDLYDCIRVLTPVLTFDSERTLRARNVQLYDRIETASGVWSEVLGFQSDGAPLLAPWRAAGAWRYVAEPGGEATVYRLTLGRMFGWTSTRLKLRTDGGIPEASGWRTATGAAAATPSMADGVRVDIIRHGSQAGQTRDVDTGGIHITAAAVNATVRNVSVRRGFSDEISLRGQGGVCESSSVTLGQDMGFTVDASVSPQIVRNCQATAIGNHGYYIAQFSGVESSTLEECAAYDNGTHGYGYGFGADVGAEETRIRGVGSGNALGLAGNCTVIEGRFGRPRRGKANRWAR